MSLYVNELLKILSYHQCSVSQHPWMYLKSLFLIITEASGFRLIVGVEQLV